MIDPTTLSIVLGAGLSVLVGRDVTKWAFGKDTDKEDRRRGAAQLAATLKGLGLNKIPDFLIDYSVGDYSGMYKKIKDLATLFLSGEEHVVQEFHAVYENILSAQLKTEAGRALIAAKLADASVISDPKSVVEAPKAVVQAPAAPAPASAPAEAA